MGKRKEKERNGGKEAPWELKLSSSVAEPRDVHWNSLSWYFASFSVFFVLLNFLLYS